MFCPKCGEKNKEGAEFCVKCGEKFGEKKNTTKKKTTKVSADDVKDAAVEVTKEMTNETTKIVKDMVVAPVDALKKYGEEKRFNLALVLVGIMSILVGLFGMALLKSVSAALNSLMSNLYSGFLGLGSSYGSTPDLPYAKTFFYSLIATFVLSFIFVGILYLVNNLIFKGKESFKKMFVVYGIISIVISATVLASTILSFVSLKIAGLVLTLGLALSSFYIFHMIRLIGPKDENKHGYIYVITTVLFYLAVYIIAKIIM